MRKRTSEKLTAFGQWAKKQGPGVLTRAMHATGLAWCTVSKAQHRRVTRDAAEALSAFTGRQVKVADLVVPSRYAGAANAT